MLRYSLYCLVLFFILTFFTPGYAIEFTNIYCDDANDTYRQIQFWAEKSLFIGDYTFGSGATKHLNLEQVDADQSLETPHAKISAHFDREFNRLIKGSLPYYDTSKIGEKVLAEITVKHRDDDNLFEIANIEKMVRIKKLYGDNPAAFFCSIYLERFDYPILYEMRCTIVANEYLANIDEIYVERIDYSSPEKLVDNISNLMTSVMTELSGVMKEVNSCK